MPSQPTLVAMPRLGMTMREGRLVAWRVAPGAAVTRGAPLLVIESDKAEVEIEAPASGFLRHVYAAAGATRACGEPLGVLTESAGEPFDPESFLVGRREAPEAGPETGSGETGPAGGGETGPAPQRSAGPPVSPAARVLARSLGIDPGRLPGSGPGGRVTRQDVEAYRQALAARRPGADGCALEVHEVGEGPPALLHPGFGADWTVFARLLPGLAAGHRVCALNPRGVGLSEAPGGSALGVEILSRDAAALAEGGAHVVGVSLGAAVALDVALAHPGRVLSLVLVTPVLGPGGRLLPVLETWAELAGRISPADLARALLPWLFSPAFLADAERRERSAGAFAAVASRVPCDTLRRMVRGFRDWPGVGREAVSALRVPTRIVTAGEDLLTPDGRWLMDWIHGASLVEVAGSGHAVTLEAPAPVEAAIREHWAQVEGEAS